MLLFTFVSGVQALIQAIDSGLCQLFGLAFDIGLLVPAFRPEHTVYALLLSAEDVGDDDAPEVGGHAAVATSGAQLLVDRAPARNGRFVSRLTPTGRVKVLLEVYVAAQGRALREAYLVDLCRHPHHGVHDANTTRLLRRDDRVPRHLSRATGCVCRLQAWPSTS